MLSNADDKQLNGMSINLDNTLGESGKGHKS